MRNIGNELPAHLLQLLKIMHHFFKAAGQCTNLRRLFNVQLDVEISSCNSFGRFGQFLDWSHQIYRSNQD
ncbi:hypothetical protein D3C76_1802170 [compost metagenome]